jgi:hypothetical protein
MALTKSAQEPDLICTTDRNPITALLGAIRTTNLVRMKENEQFSLRGVTPP